MSNRRKSAYGDAARRVADTYALHRLADPIGNIGQWFAVRLSDGTSDNTLYPSKKDCILHQHGEEQLYAYVQIVPATMTPEDAQIFLNTHRKLYDAGIRLVDPDHSAGGLDLITRVNREDQLANIKAALRMGKPSNLIVGKDIY